jgi:sodium-type flagellar protein MotY
MVFWAKIILRVVGCWLMLLGIYGALAAPAWAQGYGAAITESSWQLVTGPFKCSITHKIPHYGSAILIREATKPEVLVLRQDRTILAAGEVTLLSSPPSWRLEQETVLLGRLVAVAGSTPISLGSEQLAAVISTLNTGRRVVFSGVAAGASNQAGYGAGGLVHVALASQNFAPAYTQYQTCLGKLIHHSFHQLARSLLLYSPESGALSASTKARLEVLARYIKADKQVLGVIIDGHSDQLKDVKASEAIAQLQAELSRDYLMAKGVAAGMIKTRWHGARFPVAANLSAAGRAKNRRVVVRLETEATRRDAERKQKLLEAEASESSLAVSSAAPAAAGNSDVLERLVRMVEEQDLQEGKVPQQNSWDEPAAATH